MRGLVVGKFYPLHKGHDYLIDTALSRCDELDVLVVDNPNYKIDVKLRASWVAKQHPKAKVRIIPDINDDDNSVAWGKHTIDFLGHAPDVVFSSESYGKTYAEAMSCKHVMLDRSRKTVPISGTKIRQSLFQYWDFLGPAVKEDLAVRIVLLGAESTGTTTLSQSLSKYYKAPWTVELGRYYAQSITDGRLDWADVDFLNIANLQQKYESMLASRSKGLLICDTNATATGLWQKRYLGKTSEELLALGQQDKVDLYIITGDEIPFVQDGTRDGEHIRHQMHQEFIELIKNTGKPFIIVEWSHSKRLKDAVKAIDRVFEAKKVIDLVDYNQAN